MFQFSIISNWYVNVNVLPIFWMTPDTSIPSISIDPIIPFFIYKSIRFTPAAHTWYKVNLCWCCYLHQSTNTWIRTCPSCKVGRGRSSRVNSFPFTTIECIIEYCEHIHKCMLKHITTLWNNISSSIFQTA